MPGSYSVGLKREMKAVPILGTARPSSKRMQHIENSHKPTQTELSLGFQPRDKDPKLDCWQR
jgi:hypothetical protein